MKISLALAALAVAITPAVAHAQGGDTAIGTASAPDGQAADFHLAAASTATGDDTDASYKDRAPAANIQTKSAPDITVGVTLTAATDYVWRGFSQTNQNPAVFAAVSLSGHGFYLGAETENVKFAGVRQEYDVWGGYVLPLGPVKLDAGFVRYGYVDAPAHIDTLEGKAALSTDIGKLSVHVAGYFTGNYFGSHHGAEYYEVGASYPILPKLSASGVFGRQHVDSSSASYNTWNLGLSYALMKGVSLGVRYHDTDTDEFGDLGRSRVVGSFSVSF